MKQRTDNFGRAYAGSQLQIQTYVNLRQRELDAAVRAAIPELGARNAQFEWVSPLASDHFAEYQDGAFLERLGLSCYRASLAAFWPSGGPQWDGLARVTLDGDPSGGVLLVEAKSYPKEMVGNGCLAGEKSRALIVESIARAKRWLGASGGDWTGCYYQMANRLAHLYFFREICGMSCWLVNLCFHDDPHESVRREVWEGALEFPARALGLPPQGIPFTANVLLPAQAREGIETAGVFSLAERAGFAAGKEWRFLANARTGEHRFAGLANVKGSCSLRYFDARSGEVLGKPRRVRGRSYQVAFSSVLREGPEVVGPHSVSAAAIPAEWLKAMREECGLDDMVTAPTTRPKDSLFAGTDEFLDEILGVREVGSTAPHYRHRTSQRLVAGSEGIDGVRLVRGYYDRLLRNWMGGECRSDENWRFSTQLRIDPNNQSVEKQLEKAIAAACPGWVNMIPVCAGVAGDCDNGRRIDLARQLSPGWFEFVELKVGEGCDTPLYAAMEILGYGLAYLFSRRNADALGYSLRKPVLAARRVSLKVIAPAEIYRFGALDVLEREVNRGLRALVQPEDGVEIEFRFEHFPAGALWRVGEPACSYFDSRARTYQP